MEETKFVLSELIEFEDRKNLSLFWHFHFLSVLRLKCKTLLCKKLQKKSLHLSGENISSVRLMSTAISTAQNRSIIVLQNTSYNCQITQNYLKFLELSVHEVSKPRTETVDFFH